MRAVILFQLDLIGSQIQGLVRKRAVILFAQLLLSFLHIDRMTSKFTQMIELGINLQILKQASSDDKFEECYNSCKRLSICVNLRRRSQANFKIFFHYVPTQQTPNQFVFIVQEQ